MPNPGFVASSGQQTSQQSKSNAKQPAGPSKSKRNVKQPAGPSSSTKQPVAPSSAVADANEGKLEDENEQPILRA